MRRIEDLQLNGLKIVQETDYFCFGTDSVLLANFAVGHSHITKETKIIDFCTGNGIIPLLLAGKTESENIIGVEIQKEVADLAKENIELNNLQNRIKIICDDINNLSATLCQPSAVICNPPYKPANSGLLTANNFQNIARNEITITLEQIIAKASEILVDKGKFFMVHKPERLAEIFVLLNRYNLEPKTLQLVHNSIEKPPSLVLVEAVKGANSHLAIEKPIFLNADGTDDTDFRR